MKVTLAALLVALAPGVALAQPDRTRVQLSAGYEQWAFRDIARTSLPMDGSPVALEGDGPVVAVRYQGGTRARLHRVEGSFMRAGTLRYESPLQSVTLADGNRLTRIDGRYQWRFYPWRDVLTDGLDLGVGIQGSVHYRSLNRTLTNATFEVTEWDFGVAGPLSARYRRGARFEADVTWNLGLFVTRAQQWHSGGAGVEDYYGGGGPLSELSARAAFQLTPQFDLVACLERADDWHFSSHRTYSVRRTQFSIGVSYAY